MLVNLTKVVLIDINENEITPKSGRELYKAIANIMYNKTRNLDLLEIAMQMNKGEPVEMTVVQVNEMRRLIKDPANGVFAFTRKAVFVYLNELMSE